MSRVGIIGAGSWGTALSVLLDDNGHQVTIWSVSPSAWMDSLEPILFWERCASSLKQMTLERSVSNPVVSANF